MHINHDRWIQIACPRLSLDWGYAFRAPLLNPFEAEIAFGGHEWDQKSYSMDYYSKEGNISYFTCVIRMKYISHEYDVFFVSDFHQSYRGILEQLFQRKARLWK